MTDGLLKMRAIFKLEEILDKIDVLMIDEIHERSANIDMLLLILNIYYKLAKRKLKLVLCSATIDTKIGDLMKDAGLKIDTFAVEVNRHPVMEIPIKEDTIINKIL
jgi:ATP-dependent RNA helicase DHX37/DHR1